MVIGWSFLQQIKTSLYLVFDLSIYIIRPVFSGNHFKCSTTENVFRVLYFVDYFGYCILLIIVNKYYFARNVTYAQKKREQFYETINLKCTLWVKYMYDVLQGLLVFEVALHYVIENCLLSLVDLRDININVQLFFTYPIREKDTSMWFNNV